MKTKTIIYVAALLMLCACSSTTKMDSVEGFEEVIATVNKHVDKKYEIVSIKVFEEDKLSNNLGSIYVGMYHEGKSFELTIHSGMEPELSDGKGSYNGDVSKIKGIDLTKIDKEKLRAYIEQAVEEVSEAAGDVEYVYRGVGNFSIDNNGKGDEIKYDFSINIVEKEGATRQEGRRIVTDYYEVKFDVDKDGNMKMRD